jgi:hypothetical protein
VLKAQSVPEDNDKAVKAIVEEIEARKEFPGGSAIRPLPTHVECPSCLSWDVDAIETTVRLTKAGVRSVQTAAQYNCRHCFHEWNIQG